MKRLVLIIACAAGLAAAGSAQAVSFGCGLPEAQPLWIEFSDGSVDFRRDLFGKPGVVVATNGVERAADMRTLGAHTVYWHMFLQGPAGRPTTPRDEPTMVERTAALIERARAATGCSTPVIALNELNGAQRPTPWPPEVVQYRANVLYVVRTMAEAGLKPMLLVPGPPRGSRAPFVGDTAADWWRQVAQYAWIVRQMHFNAPYIYARGPILGARLRRVAMRDAVRPFLDLGIPADRLGLLLGFQSGPGKGGREGLQPTEAWLQIVKQDTLAAKQVAAELGLSSVWSWGWGTFNIEGADPDKPVAACVYLWTRDASLCNAPAVAGPAFNASLTEGQIILPGGVQCSLGQDAITIAAFEQTIPLVGGDRTLALSALLNRALYARAGGTAPGPDVQAAEQALIDAAFGGDSGAYEADLAAHGVTRAAALQAIGDELRRQQAEARLAIASPGLGAFSWLARAQRLALRSAICLNDEVPKRLSFTWSTPFPWLVLPEATLTLEADKRVVKRGGTVVLSGQAAGGVRPRERVTVYARQEGGAWREIGEAKVADDGSWSLEVVPTGKGTAYRAVSKSAASDAVSVRVRAKKGAKP